MVGIMGAVQDIAVGSILVILSLIIALAVYPSLADNVAFAQASTNVTGAEDTMLDLIPLVVAAAVLIGGVAYLVKGARGLGKD